MQTCIKNEPNTVVFSVLTDDKEVNFSNVVGDTVCIVVAAVVVDLGNDVDSTGIKQSISPSYPQES